VVGGVVVGGSVVGGSVVGGSVRGVVVAVGPGRRPGARDRAGHRRRGRGAAGARSGNGPAGAAAAGAAAPGAAGAAGAAGRAGRRGPRRQHLGAGGRQLAGGRQHRLLALRLAAGLSGLVGAHQRRQPAPDPDQGGGLGGLGGGRLLGGCLQGGQGGVGRPLLAGQSAGLAQLGAAQDEQLGDVAVLGAGQDLGVTLGHHDLAGGVDGQARPGRGAGVEVGGHRLPAELCLGGREVGGGGGQVPAGDDHGGVHPGGPQAGAVGLLGQLVEADPLGLYLLGQGGGLRLQGGRGGRRLRAGCRRRRRPRPRPGGRGNGPRRQAEGTGGGGSHRHGHHPTGATHGYPLSDPGHSSHSAHSFHIGTSSHRGEEQVVALAAVPSPHDRGRAA
jgi:hypothetical protein